MKRWGISWALIVLIAPIFVFASPAKAAVNWTKIYETTNSRRSDGGTTSYMSYSSGYGKTGGAASSFSGSWDRIKIRMELTQISNSTKYYSEVAFDKWSGATLASLQFPDYVNNLVVDTNVTNLIVTSDTSAVKTGSFPLGRVEIWPYNYSQSVSGLSPAGSSLTYDWDDTYLTNQDGHGSYQVHTLIDSQTVMAWNMHRNIGAQDFGLGSKPTGDPDWTSSGSGGTAVWNNTNFLVQVFVGQTITSTTVNAPTLTSGGAKSSSTTIKATASAPGRITFYSNGKKIPGCIKVATVDVSGTATSTCLFRPNTSGQIKYSTQFTPTDSTMTGSNSGTTVIPVGRRTGNR